jgi:hypothetical protein
VENAANVGPSAPRKYFGHQGAGYRPLTADAKRYEKAEGNQMPPLLRKSREARKD